MSYNDIAAGKSLPEDINVVIEIPANADPIKYEIDKDSGEVFVDRFFSTPMHYPCNYGYIPNTLCGDGDPADVLVIAPYNLIPGCVIRCRPVGILHMEDDGGEDSKLIAVPVSKLTKIYDNVKDIDDVEPLLRQQIQHFFEHYKDLEEGKWVKIKGWGGVKDAHKEIMDSIEREKNA